MKRSPCYRPRRGGRGRQSPYRRQSYSLQRRSIFLRQDEALTCPQPIGFLRGPLYPKAYAMDLFTTRQAGKEADDGPESESQSRRA